MQWPSLDPVVSWQTPWLLSMNTPDPEAKGIVGTYLNALIAMGLPPENHGIWVQTGNTAIAVHQPYQPLPAASLTKMATTLAALETWPIDHQFETLIGYTGTIENGVVNGDLVIRWTGDPYFVSEEAIAIANTLKQQGLQTVTGNLIVLGAFSMNFEVDATRSGELFLQTLDANRWIADEVYAYSNMPPDTPQPNLIIQGQVAVQSPDSLQEVQWLVRHQSLPLIPLLKAMNIYSNNEMAEQLATACGGTNTVIAKVVERTQLPVAEIRLINGSGLGEDNRLSPRAVVAILLEIQRQLHPHGLSIADVMPVFGQDEGTLIFREMPPQAAVKTGTLNTVSSLAGYFPTRDRGPVWFSIQNTGSDLETLRARQDALLLALEQHWGKAAPADAFQPQVVLGQRPYVLGDASRNLPYTPTTATISPPG
jgi:D-alanyl-D-alanine carboxypeptidase/D-alanyl-D-alanine-endopeptidase (penicillin-binding protein 4)